MANTPPNGLQFAIPDFKTTTNSIIVSGEPGTLQAIATGQDFDYMNGTYTTIASHYYFGNMSIYGSDNCFKRSSIPPVDINGFYYGPCWQSRSASNNYNGSGVYQGSTSTVVSGTTIKGEYVTITSPYGIILKAYSLISSNFNGSSLPAASWVIAGSNDNGATYTTVDVITNNPLPLGGYGLFNVSNSTSYKTYIIIITSIATGSSAAANIGTWNIYAPATNAPCFKKDTKILCMKNNNEEYIPIQNIRKGDLVKTFQNGYVQVNMIGRSYVYNSGDKNQIKERLYRYTSEDYPELVEDLIITGCHALLVKHLTDLEINKTIELFGELLIIDNHCRLITVVNRKAIPYEIEGTFEIWHLALDNDRYFSNYGIFANGLLVETCSKSYMKDHSAMELIE